MEARSHFMDAVSLEADCAEAIYNLGLVSKAVGNLDDALTAFKRMNSMLTDDTAAMFQVHTWSTCWNCTRASYALQQQVHQLCCVKWVLSKTNMAAAQHACNV